MECKVRKR